MHYVYILTSKAKPHKRYYGFCTNLKNRLKEHNSGECKTTASSSDWQIENAFFFRDEHKARNFERYLKTGSGRAFSKRHF